MKRLIFTLFTLLATLTAGAQDFVIVAVGSNGQPEAYTLDEISSWGYAGNSFFINDENEAQVFSATGDKFDFSSAELEEGEYFITTFYRNRQAKFLIGPDLKINWKDSRLTIKDKNRSGEFLLEDIPRLSIERGTYGYVDPYITDAIRPLGSRLFFVLGEGRKLTSFSDAYTASIDKDYFYFSGPAGIIKFSRASITTCGLDFGAEGTLYR
jgi:hypothetical protein